MKVSNTGPLIILFKINKLWVLEKIYKQILIAKAVEAELLRKSDGKKIIELPWIKVQQVPESQSLKVLRSILDDGEAETILLAEIKQIPVILDEKKGRNRARSLDLKVQGSLGIIVKAKRMGLISSVKEVLEELLVKGYYIRDDLKKEVLKSVQEN